MTAVLLRLREREVRMKTFDSMIAKPKECALLMINGGRDGYISLHPNQKWKVAFDDEKVRIELENRFLTMYLPKEQFKKYFAICFEGAE